MGLSYHIFMTDLRTGDWIPPTSRRLAPVQEPPNETGEDPSALQCSDSIYEQSSLKPELDESVTLSKCLTFPIYSFGLCSCGFLVHPL